MPKTNFSIIETVTTTPVVVDVDPLTGAQLTISRNGNGNLVLQETGPAVGPQATSAYRTVLVYNRDLGVLEAFFQEIAYVTNVTQIELGRTGGSSLAQLNNQPPLQELPMLPGDSTAGSVQIFMPMITR